MTNQVSVSNKKSNNSSKMKKAMVLHNPEAGEGDTSKRELIRMIESEGFKCSYSSTKNFHWENIETEEVDLLILAGGDGTVRKIAEELLGRKVIEKNFPIGLLPLGTANNIAKTLGGCKDSRDLLRGWHQGDVTKFDVGKIDGLEKPSFFLESYGYGLFPKLISQMKNRKRKEPDDPSEKLKAALETLRDLILKTPAKKCHLGLDGKDYSGEFLLVEVMNIRSIGPNLHLSPGADPGDGLFDVVLITEKQRQALADYTQLKIDGREVVFDFPVLQAREIEINWDGRHVHVDDEYFKLKKPAKINIELRQGLLEFLLPLKDIK